MKAPAILLLGGACLFGACRTPAGAGSASSTGSTVPAIQEPEFEIVNFRMSEDPRAATNAFYSKYRGEGTLTSTNKDQVFNVYIPYRRKDLTTNAVEDGWAYVPRLTNGVGTFEASCSGSNPCEFTWTGIQYEVVYKGKLKNITDPAGIRPEKK